MSVAAVERAFVERFRAKFGGDMSLPTRGEEAQGDRQGGDGSGARNGAGNEEEIDRLLPRFGGGGRRKKRASALTSAVPTCSVSERPPDVLRRCLWTIFRRFEDRLWVKGRLLNLEELLVTHFMRVDPSGSASKAASSNEVCDQKTCVHIKEGSVRLVVRCVGAVAAQIGQDDVLARLVSPHDVDAQLIAMDDANETDALPLNSARPVAAVMSLTECDAPWSEQQPLEEMTSVYGFDIDAFASSGLDVASEHSDDEELPLNALLMSTRLFHDLRGSDKMMEMFQVPPDTFQSFTWAAASKRRQQSSDHAADKLKTSIEPDLWSYRALDSAQKRKWADERYEYGLELVEKRKLREAMTEFESALKLNDRHAGALAAKGRAHMAAHQLQDAVDCLERAVDIDPLLAGASDDLLRAKGMLAHSRHVSTNSRYDLNRTRAETDRGAAAPRDRSSHERLEPRNSGRERARVENRRSATSTKSAKNLEEERLRALLEEEERRRRGTRQSRRRSRSDSAESDSSDGGRGPSRERRRSSSKKRKREKKHKKEKRKHKKSDRKRKNKKSSKKDGERFESDYSLSDSRSSRSSDASRRSNQRRSPRGGSKSRPDEDNSGELPAILSRTKHRIWN